MNKKKYMSAKEKAFEEKKARLMRILKCSEEEAIDVITNDEIIDKGGRTEFDLPKELEKEIYNKYVHSHTNKMKGTKKEMPTVYDFSKKVERKGNATKASIVNQLYNFLTETGIADSAEITNKERMIAFSIGDDNFEVTLIQKRKPKN